MRARFWVALGCLVASLAAQPASAATYSVSTSGNDANSGTPGSPWKTINKAALMVSPGDTVVIEPGTYKERVRLTRSGSASAPITFKGASATQATIIDGTGTVGSGEPTMLNFGNASYIKIAGLSITNGPGWGVAVTGNSHHVELSQLDVSTCKQSGIWIAPGNTTPNYTIVRQSKVHDNLAGGITVWLAPGGYFLIEDNEAYSNKGGGNYDGIQVGGGDGATHHVVVRRNNAWGNGQGTDGADQIDLGGHGVGDHFLVEENQVRGPGGSLKVHQGSYGGGRGVIARRNQLSGVGILIYGFPNPVMYYNNTIVDSGHAFHMFDDRPDSAPGRSFGGMEVRNNLFLQSTDYLFLVNGVAGYLIDIRPSSLLFANNMYKFGGKGLAWYPRIFNAHSPDPNGAAEFAAYMAVNAPNQQDLGSRRTTAPLTSFFVDTANRNYRLRADSPAIDAGGALTKATNSGNSSKTLKVVKSDFFQDGYGGLVAADFVRVGSNAPVQITQVDEASNTITLASPISWSTNDAVTLPYEGSSPDVGAFEYQGGLPSPNLLSVEPVG